jgi:hypothetical protein
MLPREDHAGPDLSCRFGENHAQGEEIRLVEGWIVEMDDSANRATLAGQLERGAV